MHLWGSKTHLQQERYFRCLEETCPHLRRPFPRKSYVENRSPTLWLLLQGHWRSWIIHRSSASRIEPHAFVQNNNCVAQHGNLDGFQFLIRVANWGHSACMCWSGLKVNSMHETWFRDVGIWIIWVSTLIMHQHIVNHSKSLGGKFRKDLQKEISKNKNKNNNTNTKHPQIATCKT